MKPWDYMISIILINNYTGEVDTLVSDVVCFIESISKLRGPQRPATKYYKLRREDKTNKCLAYSDTSNPKKRSKREGKKLTEKYSY